MPQLRSNEMEYSDLFRSVQGEGPRSGTPSVFLRLRRCNLACGWCDTKYTWDPTAKGYNDYRVSTYAALARLVEDEAKKGLPAEIAETLGLKPGEAIHNLVITGGEPLIWRRQIEKLINWTTRSGPITSIEIETNGTMLPLTVPNVPAFWPTIRYNVSPKLLNSGNGDGRVLYREEALKQLAAQDSIFKFVIQDPGQDQHEVNHWILRLEDLGVSSGRIFLMPEATTKLELEQRAGAVLNMARKREVQYGDRMHVRLWGARRGV